MKIIKYLILSVLLIGMHNRIKADGLSGTIDGSVSVCQGKSGINITFKGSGGTSPYTFVYRMNGGAFQSIKTSETGNDVTLAVQTTQPGVFEYSLDSVSDQFGQLIAQPGKATVTVNEMPTISGNFLLCLFSGKTQLIGSGTLANSTLWKSSNISVANIDNQGWVTPVAAGSTIITYENSNGCSVTEELKVNALPQINAVDFLDNQCSGSDISFSANVNGVAPLTYNWYFGDGTTSTAFNPVHSFNSIGCGTEKFSVKLTVTDANGCSSSTTKEITIAQKPDIEFEDVDATSASNQFSNCRNASASNPEYTITVGNISNSTCITSFSINWGDGITKSNISFPITHTYSKLGAYSMVITANGSNGCVNSKSYLVKNVSNPSGGIISPGNTQNLCAPTDNLQFEISKWGTNSPGTTYRINYGDGTAELVLTQEQMRNSTFFNEANPEASSNYPVPHSYTQSSCPSSQFTVTLTVENACGSTIGTISNISILTKPDANFTATTKACVNTSFTFLNTTKQGYDTDCSQSTKYKWDFGDSNTQSTGWITTPQNISHTYTTPGTYNVTLTAQNGCGTTTKTQQICVEPSITPSFTINNIEGCAPLKITTTNTIDVSKACSAPTYNWSVTRTGGNPAYSYVDGTTNTSASPVIQLSSAGTYTLTMTAIGACGAQSVSKTVTVKSAPAVTLATISPLCQTGTSTVVNPSATVVNNATQPLTYSWSFPGGTPEASTDAIPGQITYSSFGTFTYSVSVTNECGTTTSSKTFTVNPAPILNDIPNQAKCAGALSDPVIFTSNLANTAYTWTNNNTNIGLPATGTGNLVAYTLKNNGTTTLTAMITVTPKVTTTDCVGESKTFTIQVLPSPKVSPINNITLCSGSNQTEFAFSSTVSDMTYSWNSSNATEIGLPANSGTGNLPAFVATNNSSTPKVVNVTVIPSNSNGCLGTPVTFTITVNPLLTISKEPLSTQKICVGGTINPLTVSYTGGAGTTTYQWYSNTSNSHIGGTLISGATSSSYTPPIFTVAGNYYYYVVVSQSGSGCGAVTSQTAEVNVLPDPIVTTQPLASQTVCQSTASGELKVEESGGEGIFSYQWYRNNTNSNSGGTAISGAAAANFTPPTDVVGTRYYYCTISQTGLGCATVSDVAKVVVVPAPVITTQPQSSSVCLDGSATQLSVAYINGIGIPSYQWYSNTTNSNTGGTAINGATGSTYDPVTSAEGTSYYYCVISLSGGGCSSITSDVATVKVNRLPTISTEPLPTQKICVGGIIVPLTVSYTGGSGTPTYQWYRNATNSIIGGTAIPGATSATYTPPVFNTPGSYYYYVVVSLNGNGCGTMISQTAEVNVLPDPTVTTQPLASQTVCQSTSPEELKVDAAGGEGIFSYQWYRNNTNSNSGGTAISGAATANFTPPTDVVGTRYYYCTISQTGLGCATVSDVAKVVVVPAPMITTQPQSSSVCLDGSATQLSIAYINGTGTPSFQWYSNKTNNNTGGTAINGATGSTYDPVTSAEGTSYYYCVISLSGGGCSSITSDVANVTVNRLPTISAGPLPTQKICVGGIIAPLTVSYTGGSGTPTYQWYRNATNSIIGGTAIPGATSATYTPPVFNAPGSYYYYVIVSLNGNGCGTMISQTAEVNVLPDPTVTTQPLASQTVCQSTSPEELKVDAAGGEGTFSYQWYRNNTNSNSGGTAISGAATASFTPPTDVVGTRYYYCAISQTGLGCATTSDVAEVTVKLAPTFVTQPIPSTICKGETPTILSVSYKDGVGAPLYQWYSNTINDRISGTAISGATSQSYHPSGMQVGTIYYYCIITLPTGGCSSLVSETAKVTVNQYPVISDFYREIGSGTAFMVIPVNNNTDTVPSGTMYTWIQPAINPVNSISGASAQPNAQSVISQTLTNNTKAKATVIYHVKPMAGDCDGKDFKITVVVNPPITPNAMVKDITCNGANNGEISLNIEGGNPPYVIEWNGPENFTSDKSVLTELKPGDYTLRITDGGGLPYNGIFTINEPDLLSLQTQEHKNISCFGAHNGKISVLITGGTGKYNFNWTKNNLPFATTQDITGLEPGDYVLSVTDSNNCGPVIQTYHIAEPEPLKIELIQKVNNHCAGDNNGSISVTVTGGTKVEVEPGVLDYLYNWIGPNGFVSASKDITALYSGNYQLSVTDNSGCSTLFTTEITEPESIKAEVITTPITCYGADNASIKLDISGGVPPYIAEWDNLASGFYQQNLSAKDYVITITDANQCVKTVKVTIPEAPVFRINPVVKQISCHGANDGSIKLNIEGGQGKVKLTWSDNSTSGNERNNIGPGTYTVIISDAKPCEIIHTFIIVEPQQLNVSAQVTDALDCNDTKSGSIDLTVTGGTPPYTYQWSNTSNTEDLENVQAGKYFVSVTDFNGCSKMLEYEIRRPVPLSVSVEQESRFNCSAGELQLVSSAHVSGGVPPYRYDWSTGKVSGSNGEIMTTSDNGLVALTITDALGCTTGYSFNVDLKAPGFNYHLLDCNNRTYQFKVVNPEALGSNISYFWNFGDGNTSVEVNPIHTFASPGSYQVRFTITTLLCSSTYEKTIIVEKVPELTLAQIPELCPGDSVWIHINGADFYKWENGSTADSMLIKSAGSYSVEGISKAGCKSVLNFNVSTLGLYNYSVQSDRDVVDIENPTVKVWSEVIPSSLYSWDFGDSTFAEGNYISHTYKNLKDGYYDIKLSVVNPNGCKETATKRIWITPAKIPNVFTPNGDGMNDLFMRGWRIKIYNRNGVLFYEGSEGWDGTYKHSPVSNDTYFYILYYTSEKGTKTKEGYITVVR